MTQHPKLVEAWKTRAAKHREAEKLQNMGYKRKAESNMLWVKGNKLKAESNMLWAEGKMLSAEAEKLLAEGDMAWYAAVIEVHGNVEVKWLKDGSCELSNGEVYEAETVQPAA